jgi:hypothetical protein
MRIAGTVDGTGRLWIYASGGTSRIDVLTCATTASVAHDVAVKLVNTIRDYDGSVVMVGDVVLSRHQFALRDDDRYPVPGLTLVDAMATLTWTPKMCELCGKRPAIAFDADDDKPQDYDDEQNPRPRYCAMPRHMGAFEWGCRYLCDSSESYLSSADDDAADLTVALWRMSGREPAAAPR